MKPHRNSSIGRVVGLWALPMGCRAANVGDRSRVDHLCLYVATCIVILLELDAQDNITRSVHRSDQHWPLSIGPARDLAEGRLSLTSTAKVNISSIQNACSFDKHVDWIDFTFLHSGNSLEDHVISRHSSLSMSESLGRNRRSECSLVD